MLCAAGGGIRRAIFIFFFRRTLSSRRRRRRRIERAGVGETRHKVGAISNLISAAASELFLNSPAPGISPQGAVKMQGRERESYGCAKQSPAEATDLQISQWAERKKRGLK